METLPKLAKIAYGAMRAPAIDGKVDIPAFTKIVDEAMANGINYFDTAYLYLGGNSERALKTAVVERYPRDSFYIATKIPAWVVNTREDMYRVFNEQLERVGVDYFDFYLLHSLEESHMHLYLDDEKFDYWNFGKELKEKGLIRHFGFSFHDTPERLDELLTKYSEVEFVMLQLNYLDWENPIVQARRCYEVARKHNKPIIVMEPVRGGNLASFPPRLEAKMKAINPDDSIASWAIRFCMSLEGVLTITSGTSTLEQMQDNINTMKNFKPLTREERDCLDEIAKEMLATPTVGCTDCKYCVDFCPVKINIPDIIAGLNTITLYGDHDRAHFYYRGLMLKSEPASACTKCKKCETMCPQHLDIVKAMENASKVFDKN